MVCTATFCSKKQLAAFKPGDKGCQNFSQIVQKYRSKTLEYVPDTSTEFEHAFWKKYCSICYMPWKIAL